MPTTPRKSKTLTFSLPPEMEAQVRRVMNEDDLSVSELLRQAIRLFMEEREWRRLERYGRLRAGEQGVAPEDVERLVDENRDEQDQARRTHP